MLSPNRAIAVFLLISCSCLNFSLGYQDLFGMDESHTDFDSLEDEQEEHLDYFHSDEYIELSKLSLLYSPHKLFLLAKREAKLYTLLNNFMEKSPELSNNVSMR